MLATSHSIAQINQEVNMEVYWIGTEPIEFVDIIDELGGPHYFEPIVDLVVAETRTKAWQQFVTYYKATDCYLEFMSRKSIRQLRQGVNLPAGMLSAFVASGAERGIWDAIPESWMPPKGESTNG